MGLEVQTRIERREKRGVEMKELANQLEEGWGSEKFKG